MKKSIFNAQPSRHRCRQVKPGFINPKVTDAETIEAIKKVKQDPTNL